jgi:hypothetical protein
MSTFREKAQGRTKQMVGQMIGDELLVDEGKDQERKAEQEAQPSDHGSEHTTAREARPRPDVGDGKVALRKGVNRRAAS